MSANVGKPSATEGVEGVDGPAPVRTLEDTELRDDCRVAGPVPERWPVSEPVAEAAETVGGRELPASDEGHSLRPPTLEVWLAELRASNAACRFAGRGGTCVGPALPRGVGPLFRPLELTLAGGVARLLREATLLVFVMRELATLATSSLSSSSSSSDLAAEPLARRTELTVDCVSAPPVFKGIDQSSWSGGGVALGPIARRSGVCM